MHGWLAAVLNLLGMGAGSPAVVEEIAVCGDFLADDEIEGSFLADDEIEGSFLADDEITGTFTALDC